LNFELTLVPYKDKSILYNLIQFYRYDSSEYDGNALNEHGHYLYKYLDHQWTDDYRRPFIIKVEGEIAGFALVMLDVPKQFTKLSIAETTNVMSDFFIMRKFRRQGIGKAAAFSLFDQFRGAWEIRQTVTNTSAYEFWKRAIQSYKGNEFVEKLLQDDKWRGPVFVFES